MDKKNKKKEKRDEIEAAYILNLIERNVSFNQIDLMGICAAILYSKAIFKHNKEIKPFMSKIFNITPKFYLMKSRSLIVAKVTRQIDINKKLNINTVKKEIVIFLKEQEKQQRKESGEKKRTKKTNNANEKMKIWLKNL